MKKKVMLLLIFVAGLFLIPNYVNAEESSLQAKIDKAKEGAVITLDKDYADYITVTKDITIDLAGHILSNSKDWETVNVVASTLTIKDSVGNGKIIQNAGSNAIELNTDYNADNATANKSEGRAKVVLENGTIESDGWGVTLFNNSEFVMNGGKVISTGDEAYAVCGNGTIDVNATTYGVNAKIVINGGVIESNDYAIYMPQMQGTTIITGGTITGAAGAIAIARGNLTITGGTLISLGTDAEASNKNITESGVDFANNAVIAIPAKYTRGVGEDEDAVVTISGTAKLIAKGNAELISDAIPNIAANQQAIANAKVTTKITITGGTYSSSVAKYLTDCIEEKTADGYVVKANTKLEATDTNGNEIAKFESAKPLPNNYTLTVKDKTLTNTTIKILVEKVNNKVTESIKKEKVSDKNVLATYDISVNDGENKVEINGNDSYKISLKVTDSMKNYKYFKVVYTDDEGNVKDILDATLENGYVVFNTTHLSTYSIVGYNTEEVKEENPKTFDGINLYVGLGLLSVLGLTATVIYKKKRFN